MRDLLPPNRPALVLAPMQDVTDLPFMRVLARRSRPDWFVTEYFRVHPDSRLNTYILRSISENPTGIPIFAQMIGRDIPNLVRTAKELSQYPIAGIDLNLGCPAPVVCRKDAGGGLLRSPEKVGEILAALRDAIPGRFTVKTRLGYDAPEEFPDLLEVFRSHGIDGLTIHGRTVVDRYRTPVRPDWVKLAVDTMPCPVIANGNVVDASTALAFHQKTGAAGLMVGRGAIRNPWIFSQIREGLEGKAASPRTRRDLLDYINELSEELAAEHPAFDPLLHVQRMKKTLVYICEGLDADFERAIRRMKTPAEFAALCSNHLENDDLLPFSPPDESRIFCGFRSLLDPASA
ncbi:MAG: tRNA-dihydrouridine synthase family protein [Akkermansiaceae bacterium]|nr:tRNA-dihydrouridine synthase family protein [Akkermansiaceae bacterium]